MNNILGRELKCRRHHRMPHLDIANLFAGGKHIVETGSLVNSGIGPIARANGFSICRIYKDFGLDLSNIVTKNPERHFFNIANYG